MRLLNYQPKWLVSWLLKSLTIIIGLVIFPSLAAQAASCPEGYTSRSFTSNDYSQFGTIAGGSSKSNTILGGSNTLTASISNNGSSANIQSLDNGFQVNQTMANGNQVNNITFTFAKAISNFKLNIFDIDRKQYEIWPGTPFADKVKISATTSTDNIVPPSKLTYNGRFGAVTPPDTILSENNGLSTADCNDLDFSTACLGIATFSGNQPIKSITIEYSDARSYGNAQNIIAQFKGLDDSSEVCVQNPAVKITKDDAKEVIAINTITEYKINITNTSAGSLSAVTLSDPAVAGLTKLSPLRCDNTIANNACTSPPTISQLESGFNLPSLSVRQVYALIVPTLVKTPNTSITNKAIANHPSLSKPITAEDTNRVTNPIDPDTPPNRPVECPAGWVADTFAPSDYASLVSNLGESPAYTLLTGLNNESYVKARIKIAYSNLLVNPKFSAKSSIKNGKQQSYIGQNHRVKSSTGYTTLEYEFTNSFDNTPQELNNFTFNIYDIDANTSAYQDQVTIIGFTKNNTQVTPTLITKGSRVLGSGSQYYADDKSAGDLCDSSKFEIDCYVSIRFNEPITRFQIRYDNNTTMEIKSYSPQEIASEVEGYCYQPQPRLIYSKQLNGNRLNNTDQFKIQILDNLDNTVVTNNIGSTTTAGTQNTITNSTGTTGVFKIIPTKSYQLSEVAAGSTNLKDYTATYECKTLTGEIINPLNPKNLKMTYGDKWLCTVTNKPKNYTIAGNVFNDNGGILAANESESAITGYIDNADYFDGVFNKTKESGIAFTPGHTITLANCDGGSSFTPQTVNIGNDGSYKFELTPQQKGVNTKLCVTQNEPADYEYSVDTTSNILTVDFVANQYDYLKKDFGDIKSINAALVLQKRQYIAECNKMPASLTDADINQADVTNTGKDSIYPRDGFSKNDPKNTDNEGNSIIVAPGLCIAYKITAINRGHVELTDVKISDELQTDPVISYYLSEPATITPDNEGLESAPQDDANGTIVTNGFVLPPASGNTPTTKSLYFNTRYGNQ